MKTFKQVVSNIEDASRDTDKVLKAARLQRSPNSYMTGEQKFYLLTTFIVCAAVLGFFFIMIGGMR